MIFKSRIENYTAFIEIKIMINSKEVIHNVDIPNIINLFVYILEHYCM